MTDASYTLSEAAGILGLEPHRVRELARRSLVVPRAVAPGEDRFTFQELVLLKTAVRLLEEKVPLRRIKQALEAVARELPKDRPLSGIRVRSEGRRIVAEEEATRWEPATGQLLFDFEEGLSLATIEALPTPVLLQAAEVSVERLSAEEWYSLGRELEETSVDEARDAYRRALELEPAHVHARVDLGRLLHDAGRNDSAEAHYRLAESLSPSASAAFNLGLLLEDRGQLADAETAYRRATTLEPSHTGALLNLAKLLERLGRKKEALRALKAYYDVVKQPEI